MSARVFVLVLAIGAAVRVAALPLAGAYDVMKGWSYVAATRGEPRLYDWAGAREDRSLRRVDGFYAEGDYPPLALYALGLAGRIYYRATAGVFPDTPALTAVVKAPALAAEAVIAVLLFMVVRRAAAVRSARLAVAMFWLNPAMLLSTAVHGLVDALFVLPALGALVAAAAGRTGLAGGLVAAAALTKPQGLLVGPAVVLAVWHARGPNRMSRFRRALAGAAGAVLVVMAPIAAAGATANMFRAMGSTMLGGDMLSNACNLWWVVGHIVYVMQMPGVDPVSALTVTAPMVPISSLMAFDAPAVRLVIRLAGATLALGAVAWGLWTTRRAGDLWLQAAAAAFAVHAYVVLAMQVHETHLFAAVPLLALAAAGRPRFLPILAVVSLVLVLNLNLLYGLGEPDLRYAIPRGATGIDFMLLASLGNCAALGWHAAVLRRESAVAADGRYDTAGARLAT